jgi:glycosyltransferase involved in cell wall biosynthesis
MGVDATAARPRVLRVIARLNVGGPARHVVILDEGLRRQGLSTLLAHGDVATGEASMEGLASDAGIPTRRIRGLGRTVRPLDDLRALAALVGLVFSWRPDVVHTHTAKAGSLGRVAAWLYNLTCSRQRRCVVVHTFHGHVFHGYFGRAGSAAVRWIERALARVTDRVLVLSPRLLDEIASTYRIAPRTKLRIVPLGLELGPLLQLERRYARGAAAPFVFGYVGRLVPVKNLPLLLSALELARAVNPRVRLLLVGEGESGEQLRALVAARRLGDVVELAGWCTDLPAVYERFDALLLGSLNEGTPVAVIEAMAAGLPVVATAVGGVPDVITDGEDGVLVAPGDAPAMAAAMLRLAGDERERRRLGIAARASVERRYSAERLLSNVAQLYEQALQETRGSAAGP